MTCLISTVGITAKAPYTTKIIVIDMTKPNRRARLFSNLEQYWKMECIPITVTTSKPIEIATTT